MEEGNVVKYIGPDTYKDKLLDISAKRMVFVLYHIMRVRNGDIMPDIKRMDAVANEHGIFTKDLEELICYERWLRQGEL